MHKELSIFLFVFLLLPEVLWALPKFPLDQEYNLIAVKKTKISTSMTFVPPGYGVQDARQMVHYLSVSAPGDISSKEYLKEFLNLSLRDCPASTMTIIGDAKKYSVGEFKLQGCKEGPDTRVIIKNFSDKDNSYILDYTVREDSMIGLKEKIWKDYREKWLNYLPSLPDDLSVRECHLYRDLTGKEECYLVPNAEQKEMHKKIFLVPQVDDTFDGQAWDLIRSEKGPGYVNNMIFVHRGRLMEDGSPEMIYFQGADLGSDDGNTPVVRASFKVALEEYQSRCSVTGKVLEANNDNELWELQVMNCPSYTPNMWIIQRECLIPGKSGSLQYRVRKDLIKGPFDEGKIREKFLAFLKTVPNGYVDTACALKQGLTKVTNDCFSPTIDGGIPQTTGSVDIGREPVKKSDEGSNFLKKFLGL